MYVKCDFMDRKEDCFIVLTFQLVCEIVELKKRVESKTVCGRYSMWLKNVFYYFATLKWFCKPGRIGFVKRWM